MSYRAEEYFNGIYDFVDGRHIYLAEWGGENNWINITDPIFIGGNVFFNFL